MGPGWPVARPGMLYVASSISRDPLRGTGYRASVVPSGRVPSGEVFLILGPDPPDDGPVNAGDTVFGGASVGSTKWSALFRVSR